MRLAAKRASVLVVAFVAPAFCDPPVRLIVLVMGMFTNLRRRVGRWLDTAERNWRESQQLSRLREQRSALERSPSGPFAFLTTNSKNDVEYYLNNGWEILTHSVTDDEFPTESWHLKHDRASLRMKLKGY
jgi:hypothetical protein